MPHPKNHLKLTGDTHPPEVEYDDYGDEPGEAQPQRPERLATAAVTGIDFELRQGSPANVIRASPLKAIAIALALGFVVAKLVGR